VVALVAVGLKDRGDVLGESHLRFGRFPGHRSAWEQQQTSETNQACSNSPPHGTLELGINHGLSFCLADLFLLI
jgi:hypothetical protein